MEIICKTHADKGIAVKAPLVLPREDDYTTSVVAEIRAKDLKPVDIFKLFFTNEIMDFIRRESEKYATSNEIMDFIRRESEKYATYKGRHDFRVTTDDLYGYFAILLLSGYCKVPFRKMYWETRADTYNSLVASTMPRNRFEAIHRYLHLNDNSSLDPNDRVYKTTYRDFGKLLAAKNKQNLNTI
ncbi:Transposase IS4 [Popillia japonica]|uniref:Transposase IS4 n=1 Tax=Popillia japonica TaxID=7064 RepID=A0AAW1MMJ5_POPJA